MIVPEKNDVNIHKLFQWSKKDKVVINDRELEFYVRIVGDAEVNRARVLALRKSTELRKRLKDEDSDEHIAFIPEPDILTREHYISYILLYRSKDFHNRASREIDLPFPKEPSEDASLEEQEKYQKEIDEYPQKLEAEIQNRIRKYLEEERSRLESMSDEVLYKNYVDSVIQELCENEMYSRYLEYCTYFGLYKDENFKERLFDSFEEFENLPTQVKVYFINTYKSLEISIDELKK